MVVLERGEIPNQVWNDIYIYFLRLFIIVFFFDLSSARRTGMLSASFHLLVATLFLHCCFATQRLLPGYSPYGQRGLGPLYAYDVIFCKGGFVLSCNALFRFFGKIVLWFNGLKSGCKHNKDT